MTRTIWLAALTLVVAACGVGSDGGPPQIDFGRDVCVHCGMIIEEARFAAAYRLPDGAEKRFDDVGDLILHARFFGELDMPGIEVWVSDFDDEVLIAAESAYFVPASDVASPMGHSILAFADADRAAEVAAQTGGSRMDWDAIRDLPLTDGLVDDHHGANG